MVLITRYLFYMKSLNTQRDSYDQNNPKLILNLRYFGDCEKDRHVMIHYSQPYDHQLIFHV